MKKFIEHYGRGIVVAIVAIILITMCTPIGGNIKQQITNVISKFHTGTEKKMEQMGELTVLLTSKPELLINSPSSTDKFDYIVHYKENNIDKEYGPFKYEEGFKIPDKIDDKSDLYVEVINRGTNEKHFTNIIKYHNTKVETPKPETEVTKFQVVFVDGFGKTLKTETVIKGGDASAPVVSKEGHIFTGWDISFTNVSKNLIVTAQWKKELCDVTIKHISSSGKVIKTETIRKEYGSTLEIKPTPKDGYITPPAQKIVFDNKNKEVSFKYTLKNYKITYELDGGTLSSRKDTYNVEDETFSLETPTKNGFTFLGWTGSNGNNPQTLLSILKGSFGDKNYVANWKANKHTLTFDPNGGTTAFTSREIAVGDAYGELPIPTRDGFTFDGWYTERVNGRKVLETDKMGENDITVYAHWTINSYTYKVIYKTRSNKLLGESSVSGSFGENKDVSAKNFNGYKTPTKQNVIYDKPNKTITFLYDVINYNISYVDENGVQNPTSYNIETPTFELKNPTKIGHTFIGWQNGTNITEKVFINTGSYGDKTFTAKWSVNSYRLNFDPTGGTVNENHREIPYNSIYGDLPTPTKNGYKFLGWFTAPTGGEQVNRNTKMEALNKTVYAHWQGETYSNVIVHWAEGFINEGYNNTKNAFIIGSNNVNGEFGKTFTIGTNNSLTPPKGYKLSNSFGTKDINGVLNRYPYNTTITQKPDRMNFEFYYEPISYTITFDLNYGIGNTYTEKYTIAYGKTFNIPTREGYKFLGWKDLSTGQIITGINEGVLNNFAPEGKDFYEKMETRRVGDVRVQAQWEAISTTYNVVYKSSTGLALGSEQITGKIGTETTVTAPTENGYNVPPSQTVKWDTLDKTIEFIYTPKEYRIIYDLDGGINNTANKEVYTIETPTFSLKAPTKVGYVFKGWEVGTITKPNIEIQIGSTGNKTFKAIWLPSTNTKYTVNHYRQTNNGYELFESDIKYGTTGESISTVLTQRTYKDFTYKKSMVGTQTLSNAIIKADGSLVIDNYYDQINYTYILVDGSTFNNELHRIDALNKIKSIEFVDTKMPSLGITKMNNIDADGDGGVVGWYSIDPIDNMAKVYVSTQKAGQKVIANRNSSEMFSGYNGSTNSPLNKVELIDVNKLDVFNSKNFSWLFMCVGADATSFKIVGLDNWDVSNVTDMSHMFNSAGKNAITWNIDQLNNWNVNSVKYMASMFGEAGMKANTWNIGDLSQWDVSNVTNMRSMFSGAGENATNWSVGDLSQWNVDNVTDMSYMFSSAGANATTWNIGDLSRWNVSIVTDMSSMFRNTGANATNWSVGDLSQWNVSRVTDMSSMFSSTGKNATTWNIGNLSQWEVGNVTNMKFMFTSAGQNAKNWSVGDLSRWNVSNVTDMEWMFANTAMKSSIFNIGNLSQWDVSNVTNMAYMFSSAGANASNWNIGQLNNWNVGNVTNMSVMFSSTGYNATTWNIGDLGNWQTGNVTDMSSMFSRAGANATTWSIGDLSKWDVSNVTDMAYMFSSAGANTINWNIGDLSRWNVSNVTEMQGMFNATGQNAILYNIGDINQWNVNNVTNMSNMFNCAWQKAEPFILDLSNWNASKTTNMMSMFHSVGANKILTPKNISSNVKLMNENYPDFSTYWITERTWYDITDNNKEYLPGTFPVGFAESHTLVDTKPELTYVLVDGPTFNSKIKEVDNVNKIKSIEFVTSTKPTTGVTEILGLDSDNDGGVVGWYTVNSVDNMAEVYISTQKPGQKVVANLNSSDLLRGNNVNGSKLKLVNDIDVANLDVSNVINMDSMFYGIGRDVTNNFIIRGLNNWNTSSVQKMGHLFHSTGRAAKTWNIGDLSNWNVDNVKEMNYMFHCAGRETLNWNIGLLTNWNVSNVQNFNSMFNEAGYRSTIIKLDLSQWRPVNAIDMSNMFQRMGYEATDFNISSLSQWKTPKAKNMSYMFNGTSYYADSGLDLSQWDVSSVNLMNSMFEDFESKNSNWYLNLSGWKVSNVIEMNSMFKNAGHFSTSWNLVGLDNWNIGNVSTMNEMFYAAGFTSSNINLNLYGWTTWNLKTVDRMFYKFGYGASDFNLVVGGWTTNNITSAANMFEKAGYNAKAFVFDLSSWELNNIQNMNYMFADFKPSKLSTPMNIPWNVSQQGITTMTWYDESNSYKEYPTGTFPNGNGYNSSILVQEKPVENPLIYKGWWADIKEQPYNDYWVSDWIYLPGNGISNCTDAYINLLRRDLDPVYKKYDIRGTFIVEGKLSDGTVKELARNEIIDFVYTVDKDVRFSFNENITAYRIKTKMEGKNKDSGVIVTNPNSIYYSGEISTQVNIGFVNYKLS